MAQTQDNCYGHYHFKKKKNRLHTQQLLVPSDSEIQWTHVASFWFRAQTHSHSFTYISVDRDLFPPVDYNPFFLCVLMLNLSQICLMEETSSWLLYPLDLSPAFFEHSLAFGHKMFQAHLVLSLPQPWNWPFTRASWVLLTFWRFFSFSILLCSQNLPLTILGISISFPFLHPLYILPEWLQLFLWLLNLYLHPHQPFQLW